MKLALPCVLRMLTCAAFLLPASHAPAQETDTRIRILRVGDSITRMTATEGTLGRLLREAGLEVNFVGSQRATPDTPGADPDCEGYNGRPIEFFTRHQAIYGDEPFSNNRIIEDAIPLKRALGTYQPHLVLVMVGVNNLAGSQPDIPVERLTGLLDEFLDRLEEWMPAGTRIVLSTVPPVNEARDPANPHRNERHRLYGEQVVRPVFERRLAAGRPYTFADVFPALTAEDFSDAVHPNRAGRAKLNTVWAEAILKALGR